ncbi:hypothetical protein U8607_11325 [Methylobacterium durans]|uniref:hypothetical protein n=1 Tax=Methylobacterium durans TaxID=2202825 RepID=UPI002AFE588F|nr:hypothetical protein [Methylobacterium durans]MEA1832672.1 hypothetical protein [Methylobacterium durans]
MPCPPILDVTVANIVKLAESYRVGAIVEAEHVVDIYLACFNGYEERSIALDMLLRELSRPERRAHNRGGLFEQVEIYIDRRHRIMALDFQ